MSGALAGILVADLLTLGVALRRHWALGPPHTQASLSLMIAFGLIAALLGLSSILVALAAVHWTRRISGLVAGAAVLGLFFNPFLDWDAFLIWQVLVMLGVQTGGLAIALLAARALGYGLAFADAEGPPEGRHPPTAALRFSISDILILTGASALLLGSLRGSRPVNLGTVAYAINFAGGCAAALVGLTVLWACFGSSPVFLRVAGMILVAPIGGAFHIVAARYASLLFYWQWYSGVTTAQVVFMAIPCLMLRARGFRFVPTERREGLRRGPVLPR